MSRLDDLLEAEEETTVAAVAWQLRECDITPLETRTHDWELAGMQRALLDIADRHATECDGGCGTCEAIRRGLAVTVATVRVLADQERAAVVHRPRAA